MAHGNTLYMYSTLNCKLKALVFYTYVGLALEKTLTLSLLEAFKAKNLKLTLKDSYLLKQMYFNQIFIVGK